MLLPFKSYEGMQGDLGALTTAGFSTIRQNDEVPDA
jgi:hypothetical protein